tara:strand:+ start:796 stop:1455 length:660 start_codon:yes stop_codon:yes gene_type:complete
MKINFAIKKFKKSTTSQKLHSFVKQDLKVYQNIRILEFGVDKGISTSFFLDICKKNKGRLISVDTINYEKLFSDINWNFICTRDDNYKKIFKEIKTPLDVIFLDTEHTAKHVEKILYSYFDKLKKDGFFLIDDISWLPYAKNEYRDSEWVENNNRDTFFKILDIFNANNENLELSFSFMHSGMVKIKKLNNKKLKPPKRIKSRQNFLKNKLRNLKTNFS